MFIICHIKMEIYMNKMFKLVWIIAVFFLISSHYIFACTSVRIKTTDGYVFNARTMEGEFSFHSTISVVPKSTAYQGTLPDGSQGGLKWTTKYGMVGMNTFGFPIITDGMNEVGLQAGNLMFPGFAGYQLFDTAKADKTIAQFEVVTWILSNFATVDEVKKAIKNIRVVEGSKKKIGVIDLHYAVNDAKGNSIVIEYVSGELKVYDNPLGVMTNSPPFDWHLINLRNHINISASNVLPVDIEGIKNTGLGQGTGMLGLPGDYTPPSRFVRMVALSASALPVTGSVGGLNLAMTIINNVDIPIGAVRAHSSKGIMYDRTQWVIIEDLIGKKIYFHTYENKNWRVIEITKAFANAKGIMTIPIETPPQYQDVTSDAKNYAQLPAEYFPAGKP
jgi:choloylglycine hydrolase